MNSNIWGPSAWLFLHSITLNYPENPSYDDKINHKEFFERMGYILPCEKCRKHYKENLIKKPLNMNVLQNKKNLVSWLIDVHNEVNKLNNKRTYTYDEVIKIYDKLYKKKNGMNRKRLLLIILILLILILFFYLNNNKKCLE